jgi:hypothetical protein
VADARSSRSLREGFVKGLIGSFALLLLLAAVIHLLNEGHHRPEGAAERWLAAVSDSGRKGIRTDALARARKIGPPELGLALVPANVDGRHALFSDLEVGKATGTGDVRRVPYRLHQHVEKGEAPSRDGVILLRAAGDEWHVTALDRRRPDERVPSEGGPPPSSAPTGVWVVAVLLGVAVTVGASLLVRWAERTSGAGLPAGSVVFPS